MKDMDEKFFLCVEIGGTNLRYGVVTKDYTLKQFDKIPSKGLSDARDKGEYLKQLLDPVLTAAGGTGGDGNGSDGTGEEANGHGWTLRFA